MGKLVADIQSGRSLAPPKGEGIYKNLYYETSDHRLRMKFEVLTEMTENYCLFWIRCSVFWRRVPPKQVNIYQTTWH
jgi:hypothetical protein